MKASLAFALVTSALAGCASIPKQAGYDDVARMISERTGQKTYWDRGAPEDAEVARHVAELLRQDVTEENAIQLALLNNRTLQATYEDLGIAQADLVQAGLLRNPTFGLSVRFPEGPVGTLNTEMSLVQDFLDLFMLPLRKKLAAEQFDHAKLRLANEVFQVIGKVRQEYYTLQQLQQVVELRRTVLETAQLSAELAQRQNQAGNIGELELVTQRGAYQQAKLDLAREELHLELQRERLTRSLGLWGSQTEWKVSAKLADIPVTEEVLEHLESLAMSRRLDVATARQEAQVFTQALDVAKTSRFVGMVEIGVSRSVGPEAGIRVIGPTLRLELPLFDRRQGLIRRLEAQLRQSEKRLAGLSIDARSEVRAARLTLLSGRQVVEHYRKVLLPLRERIVALSQQHYNAMLLGVFQLLLVKQAEVEAYRQYIEAVRDYWIARVELERAAGGRLKAEQQSQSNSQLPVSVAAPVARQTEESP
jgi:cobalt-zinc-cadmium efflux system outer membrane protein